MLDPQFPPLVPTGRKGHPFSQRAPRISRGTFLNGRLVLKGGEPLALEHGDQAAWGVEGGVAGGGDALVVEFLVVRPLSAFATLPVVQGQLGPALCPHEPRLLLCYFLLFCSRFAVCCKKQSGLPTSQRFSLAGGFSFPLELFTSASLNLDSDHLS